MLLYQERELSEINRPSTVSIEKRISESEALLRSLGYERQLSDLQNTKRTLPVEHLRKVMVVPSWEKLCLEAEKSVGTGCALEDIFTQEELKSNEYAMSVEIGVLL